MIIINLKNHIVWTHTICWKAWYQLPSFYIKWTLKKQWTGYISYKVPRTAKAIKKYPKCKQKPKKNSLVFRCARAGKGASRACATWLVTPGGSFGRKGPCSSSHRHCGIAAWRRATNAWWSSNWNAGTSSNN
jgi:hypothetical protein